MADITKTMTLAQQINWLELQTAPASVTNGFLAGLIRALEAQKVDKVNGKGLSANDFSDEHLNIVNQFRPDWHGTQAQYNALTSRDASRWYIIEQDGEFQALYRGDTLIHAIPNLVGEFAADTTEEDWYWWPNDVKTAIPVDPATCKFSCYWPGILTSAVRLFQGGSGGAATVSQTPKIKRLDVIPQIGAANNFAMLPGLVFSETLPVLDMKNAKGMSYICVNNSYTHQFRRVAFRNTENMTKWEMLFNLGSNNEFRVLTGLDASLLTSTVGSPLGAQGASLVEIKNLGKAAAGVSFDLRNRRWGDDTRVAGARQSLVNSLLNWSFDRASAGYAPATITLYAAQFARLTSAEVAAINAKGFTIVTE